MYCPAWRSELTGRFARKTDGDPNYAVGTSLQGPDPPAAAATLTTISDRILDWGAHGRLTNLAKKLPGEWDRNQNRGRRHSRRGVPTIEPKRMTIAEFDIWVETADEGLAYELHDGVVYSFASGSVSHGRLCTRLGGWLIPAVSLPYEVFLGSLSVRRHPERASSVIPDALVTCEQPPAGHLYATAPKLVVEVISPTSVVNDLIRKPRIYNAVESIEEYLVVDSRSMWARVFRRDDAGELPAEGEGVTTPDSTIELRSVGLTFALAELYKGIIENVGLEN